MKKKWWVLLLVPIVIILLIIIIFLIQRSKVSLYSDGEKSFSIIGGSDGPTSVFVAGKLGGEEMRSEVITAQEAKQLMNDETDYIILDVRELDEFAEGHIEGAIQLSYMEIDEKAESVLKDKAQLILLYCRSGRRSAIAAENLVKLGYTNVKDFGGIIDWPYDVVK